MAGSIPYSSSTSFLPEFQITPGSVPQAPGPQRNIFSAGLSAGWDNFVGASGAGVAALGKAIGSDTLAKYGEDVSAYRDAQAAKHGRPDLEVNPLDLSLSQVPSYLGYQLAKQAPMIGSAMLGGAGGAMLAGRLGLAAAGARGLASAVPEVLGGASAGMTEAQLARAGGGLAGAFASQYPQSVGSMYQEALERQQLGHGDADRRDATAALLGGVPYAMMESFEPLMLSKGLHKNLVAGAGDKLATRIAKGAAVGAGTEAVTEGVQTSMEKMFRPDEDWGEKARAVVGAAITGGAIGGILGGASGIRRAQTHGAAENILNDMSQIGAEARPQLTYQPEPTAPINMPSGLPQLPAPIMYGSEIGQASTTLGDAEQARHAASWAGSLRLQDDGQAPVQEAVQTPAQETTQAPVQETTQAPAQETTQAPVQETAQAPVQETARAEPEPTPAQIKDASNARLLDIEPEMPAGARRALQHASEGELIYKAMDGLNRGGSIPIASETVLKHYGLYDEAEKAPVKPEAIQTELEAAHKANIEATEAYKADRSPETRDAALAAQQRFNEVKTKALLLEKAFQYAETAPKKGSKKAETKTQTEPTATEVPSNSPELGGKATEAAIKQTEAQETTAPERALAWEPKRETLVDREKETLEGVRSLSDDQRQKVYEAYADPENPGDTFAAHERLRDAIAKNPVGVRKQLANISGAPTATFTKSGLSSRQTAVRGSAPVEQTAASAASTATKVTEPTIHVGGQEQVTQAEPTATKAAEPAQTAQTQTQTQAEPTDEAIRKASERVVSDAKNASRKATYQEAHNYLTAKASHLFRDIRSVETHGDKAREPKWLSRVTSFTDAMSDKFGVPHVPVFVGKRVGAAWGATGNFKGNTVHGVVLDDSLGSFRATAVAIHEYGHYITNKLISKAQPAVQQTIVKNYKDWKTERASKTTYGQEFPISGIGSEDYSKTLRNDGYNYSFSEYMAEQVSRWVTTQEKPRGLVETFFKRIADIWKALYAHVVGHTPLDSEVKDFLDGAWRDDTKAEPTATSPVSTDMGDKIDAMMGTATTSQLNNLTQRVMGIANSIYENIKKGNYSAEVRPKILSISSLGHIVQTYSKVFSKGVLEGLERNVQGRETGQQRMAALSVQSLKMHDTLAAASKAGRRAAELVTKLMSGRYQRLDPTKSWEQHTWLHNDPKAKELEGLHAEVARDYVNLKRFTAKEVGTDFAPIDVYNAYKSMNNAVLFMQQAALLRTLIRTSANFVTGIPASKLDAHDTFMNNATHHESEAGAEKYWKNDLDTLLKQTKEYAEKVTQDEKGKTKSPGKEVSVLVSTAKNIEKSLKKAEQSPYFHLGRSGDYFVEYHIKADEKNKDVPDEAARQKMVAWLEREGITEYEIPPGTSNAQVYIRLPSMAAVDQLHGIAQKMYEAGLIAKRFNKDGSERPPITAGLRTLKNDGDANHATYKKVIEHLQSKLDTQASEEEKAVHTEMMGQMERFLLDLLPDTSTKKVMVQRNYVGGFSKDARWSQAYRVQQAAHAVSNMMTTPKVLESFAQMRSDIRDAKGAGNPQKTVQMQQVYKELSRKESLRATTQRSDLISAIRAFNHSWFLSLSPSYAMIQLAQLATGLHPELSKSKGGHVAAAKAIAKVTPEAMKLMREVFAEGKKGGWKNLADININSAVLQRAFGNDTETADYMARMITRGGIDMGSASRELGRISGQKEGSVIDLATRYGAYAGYFTETFTRVVAALAAREMHGCKGVELDNYAKGVLDNALYNYNTSNVARAFSHNGIAGQMTPLGTAFLSYNFFTTEKLYREMHDAFKGETKEEREAARRFLGSHLAAMTVLAGSLGLPFASVAARAIEKLKDLLDDDDQPFDAKTGWQNFLSDMFGKDVGEVLARGLPRALGFDIHNRVGEQDLFPLTKLLTDHREWQDALKDWAWRTDGAPFSMAASILKGMTDIGRGDVLAGMKSIVPASVKGPIAAFQMASDGTYQDSKGRQLPMTPGAGAILAQALGFQPAEKAAYGEAKMAVGNRKADMLRDANRLRDKIVSAIEDGDMSGARELMQRAREHDQNVPAYAVLPRVESTLRRNAQQRATAAATHTPYGTNLHDIGSLDLVRNSNVNYQ